jgi:hypothetical protein
MQAIINKKPIDINTLFVQFKEGTYADDVIDVRQGKEIGIKKWRLSADSKLLAVVTNQAIPLTDPHLYTTFTDATGKQRINIFSIDTKDYENAFYTVAEYVLREYKIFVSPYTYQSNYELQVTHDPKLTILFNAKRMPCVKPPKEKDKEKYIFTSNDLTSALINLVDFQGNITQTYKDILTLGFAFNRYFKKSSSEYLQLVLGNGYDSKQSKQITTIINHYCTYEANYDNIDMNNFWALLEKYDIPFDLSRTKSIVKAAILAKKSYGKIEDVAKIASPNKPLSLSDEELKLAIKYYENEKASGDLGDDKPNRFELAQQYLNNNHDLWIESFSGKLYDGNRQVDDLLLNSIWLKMNTAGISFKTTELLNAIESESTQYRNPVDECFRQWCEYYDPKYDPVEEIWKHLKTKFPDIDKHWFRYWCMNTIQTFYGESEGYHLVILGKGNLGKTRFLRSLFPPELQPYFIEPEFKGNKDDYAHMCSALVIFQDEELDDAIQKSNKFKRLTSRSTFTYRKAYGRGEITKKRVASTCSTSNALVIMHSEPNRRMLPIVFEAMFDYMELNKFDRKKLWGHFAYRYLVLNENAQMCQEDVEALDQISEVYKEADEIKELIAKRFYPASEVYNHGYVDYVTTTDVKSEFPPYAQRVSTKEIGSKLYEMGYQKHGMSNKWVMKYRGSSR